VARKRANGDGSIYQRKDGRWCGALTLPDGTVKRYYSRDRQEVQRRLTNALQKRNDGLPIVVNEQLTVEQLLTQWLETAVKPRVRASTFRGYESKIRTHILPALGTLRISHLTPQRLQAFLNERHRSGLSERTTGHLRDILRTALNDGAKWNLVARNVATLVDPPRVSEREFEGLSPAQAKKLLEAVKGDRLEALYTVALAVGLRQGEALGLQWQDVDLSVGTISVRRALQRLQGDYVFVDPKTKRSRRRIVLPTFAIAALEEHQKRQDKERATARNEWHETGLVFTTADGQPLHYSTVTKGFQRLLRLAGLPRQRFHDLRHACASLLLAQGVQPRVAMELLGHSQLNTTMNIYSHVIQDAQRDAAAKMNSLFAGS
jgi:integrase